MKRISLLLVLSFLFFSCGDSPSKKINGQWRTEKDFGGLPNEILTIRVDGKSIFVNVNPEGKRAYGGLSDHSIKDFTGIYREKNKFELGNGVLVEYNEDLDRIYMKSEWGGQEYVRDIEGAEINKLISKENGSSDCLITNVYKKGYSYLIDVEYLILIEDEYGITEIVDKIPKTFLLTDETDITFLYWNNRFYNNGYRVYKDNFIKYFTPKEHQVWAIKVENGKVKKLSEQYMP